jgi:acyl-coenzyme A synthetase/AMP-(fatty) acid ligase
MERGEAELADLYAWLKQHLAEPKLPVRWYLVDEIPRTSRGKINRETVRATCELGEPVNLAALLRRAS